MVKVTQLTVASHRLSYRTEMLMQLWRPGFELDRINSGSRDILLLHPVRVAKYCN